MSISERNRARHLHRPLADRLLHRARRNRLAEIGCVAIVATRMAPKRAVIWSRSDTRPSLTEKGGSGAHALRTRGAGQRASDRRARLCLVRRTVCRLQDLPEKSGYLVEVADAAVALFRVGREVFAVDNVCPHRDETARLRRPARLRWSTARCTRGASTCGTGACDEFPGVSVRTLSGCTSRATKVQLEL